VGKSSPIICSSSVIYKILPKVNNRPRGENSPNLVSLLFGRFVIYTLFGYGFPTAMTTVLILFDSYKIGPVLPDVGVNRFAAF
jgi:hypothetical protein